jgi:hypothetical protein
LKILPAGEKRLTNGFGILEDLEDIPLDEIMALGLACTAAAGTALVMIEAFNKINMSMDDRLRKAEMDVTKWVEMWDVQNRTLDILLTGAAPIVKESLVAGSILPDKVG